MKKTFRVYATSVSRYSIDIEAEDEYEAYGIAKETYGGYFVGEEVCGVNGDWKIEDNTIEEVE